MLQHVDERHERHREPCAHAGCRRSATHHLILQCRTSTGVVTKSPITLLLCKTHAREAARQGPDALIQAEGWRQIESLHLAGRKGVPDRATAQLFAAPGADPAAITAAAERKRRSLQ